MTSMLWLALVWNTGPLLEPLPLPNPKPEDCIIVPIDKTAPQPVERLDPILTA